MNIKEKYLVLGAHAIFRMNNVNVKINFGRKRDQKERNLKITPLVSWQSKRGIGLTVNRITAQIPASFVVCWK